MKPLIFAVRLIFGAWLLANGVNHFFVPLWPAPAGSGALAVQLMEALVNSRMLDLVMAVQLVSGALILAGVLVPLALCVVMPVTVCAAYWAVILEREPLGALLAILAFALNGLLMLAYVEYYRGALQRRAPSLGEQEGSAQFDFLFADPRGRTARGPFIGALLVLLAVAGFYHFLVAGATPDWGKAVLILPFVVLHARRLHDMGQPGWLVLAPGALLVATAWLQLSGGDSALTTPVTVAALVVSAGFAIWGAAGKGQSGPNRFGAAAA